MQIIFQYLDIVSLSRAAQVCRLVMMACVLRLLMYTCLYVDVLYVHAFCIYHERLELGHLTDT